MDRTETLLCEELRKKGHYTITQELYSIGWFKALCSTCLVTIDSIDRDYGLYSIKSSKPYPDMGVDVTVTGYFLNAKRKQVTCTFQLKTISDEKYIKEKFVAYNIQKKDYDNLIDDEAMIPSIIVLFVIPNDAGKWIEVHDHDHVRMRTCAYWASLKGCASIDSSKTIHFDKKNIFNSTVLREILTKLANKEEIKCNLLP